jgi:hypothetical protein
MKYFFLLISIMAQSFTVFGDEYIDPDTNVIYSFDPLGSTAEVKSGEFWAFETDPEYYPGSPNAQGDVVILSKICVNGKDYIVNKIGNYAFVKMDKLMSVFIPSTVHTIGVEAFDGCINLWSLVMSEGLKLIDVGAFSGCISLTRVSLPSGLESIKFKAFNNCIQLTSIVIPSSVTDITPTPFQGCNMLSSIKVDEGNAVYDSRGNCNAIIKTAENKMVVGCKDTHIPLSISQIGYYAFYSNLGLEEITIPNSVKIIGQRAFEFCRNLKKVTLLGELQNIEFCAFNGCGSVTFFVPMGTMATYESTPGWDESFRIEEIDIENGTVTNVNGRIGNKSFANQQTTFDLYGRLLTEKPQSEVYIHDGKKYVGK